MRTYSQTRLYIETARQILVRAGATILPAGSWYEWSVQTKVGTLLISIGEDCCITCRFDNIEAALHEGLGDRLNVHSGKWNWMGGNDHAGDMYDLACFQQALRRLKWHH